MHPLGKLVVLFAINLPSVQYQRTKEVTLMTVHGCTQEEAKEKYDIFKKANKHLSESQIHAFWQPDRRHLD